MRLRSLLLAPVVLLAGCDLLKSATATVVVSGLVVSSPALSFSGWYDVPAETAATVWVGERASATSTEEPKPITSAAVSLEFAGRRATLAQTKETPGLYTATSADQAALAFVEGASYAFDAQTTDDVYGGTTDAPRALTASAVTYSPALGSDPRAPGLMTHPKNTALRVSWSKEFGAYSILSVFRASRASPQRPELVFDTRPKTSGEVIRLISGNAPDAVEIPASTFAGDGLYAIVVFTAAKGAPYPNTFLGSPLLVGSGVATVVAVGTVQL